ncbi:hypothetical protein CB1_000995037 [Camelus ferus]|nr:hypothetical protein CB1_000995037 [Camelus ferus]
MATNIEQIFRSFVVSKFREIQQELSSCARTSCSIDGNIRATHLRNSEVSLKNGRTVSCIYISSLSAVRAVCGSNAGTIHDKNSGFPCSSTSAYYYSSAEVI